MKSIQELRFEHLTGLKKYLEDLDLQIQSSNVELKNLNIARSKLHDSHRSQAIYHLGLVIERSIRNSASEDDLQAYIANFEPNIISHQAREYLQMPKLSDEQIVEYTQRILKLENTMGGKEASINRFRNRLKVQPKKNELSQVLEGEALEIEIEDEDEDEDLKIEYTSEKFNEIVQRLKDLRFMQKKIIKQIEIIEQKQNMF